MSLGNVIDQVFRVQTGAERKEEALRDSFREERVAK